MLSRATPFYHQAITPRIGVTGTLCKREREGEREREREREKERGFIKKENHVEQGSQEYYAREKERERERGIERERDRKRI